MGPFCIPSIRKLTQFNIQTTISSKHQLLTIMQKLLRWIVRPENTQMNYSLCFFPKTSSDHYPQLSRLKTN